MTFRPRAFAPTENSKSARLARPPFSSNGSCASIRVYPFAGCELEQLRDLRASRPVGIPGVPCVDSQRATARRQVLDSKTARPCGAKTIASEVAEVPVVEGVELIQLHELHQVRELDRYVPVLLRQTPHSAATSLISDT
jgi:hypothetical protein